LEKQNWDAHPKDDYLINSLRFVSAKESTQIYGAILPECLINLAMKQSKAYKTYLGYATGVVPPKTARKFKKASPSKKDTGVVIREAPVETKSKSKEKEKVDVTRGKGIELLSEVALTEEAQMKEVRKKSLRDFHKTHLSGSGVPDVTEDDSTESESESSGNDEDDSNNDDQDSSNKDSEQENESEEQVSDSEQEEESKDDDQEEEEFVHTPFPTDDKDDENLESKSDEVIKKPTQTDKEVVQGEGADAEMIDAQQGNENLETTQEQVVEDAHVTISTTTKKTEVPATSSSRSSDLASKFLNFLDIPHTDAEIVPPFDVPVQHE
ncbi:hypothetical protein Tco_0035083, partial [Tanacetum coccineum]